MKLEVYEFGVGSGRYKLKALNKDVAKCAIMLFYRSNPPELPIVIYEPITEVFKPKFSIEILDRIAASNKEDIQSAYKSIKEL